DSTAELEEFQWGSLSRPEVSTRSSARLRASSQTIGPSLEKQSRGLNPVERSPVVLNGSITKTSRPNRDSQRCVFRASSPLGSKATQERDRARASSRVGSTKLTPLPPPVGEQKKACVPRGSRTSSPRAGRRRPRIALQKAEQASAERS